MNVADYRQQQELEEERMMKNLAVLQAARARPLAEAELLFLASELGLTTEYRNRTFERRPKHAANR